jgi:hypothetical protein
MDIVDAGFGRTGTLSLKAVPEQLGRGPCLHILDVIGSPGRIAAWQAVLDGSEAGWEKLLDGIRPGGQADVSRCYGRKKCRRAAFTSTAASISPTPRP